MNLVALFAVVGLGVAGFFAGKGGVKVGARVEDRRRTAVKLATWCSSNGLPDLGDLLTSYAVQDYSGVIHQFQTLADLVADPDRSGKAIDSFLDAQLNRKLSTQEGQDQLIAFVERALNVTIDRDSIVQPPPTLKKEG